MKLYEVVTINYIDGRYDIANFKNYKDAIIFFDSRKKDLSKEYKNNESFPEYAMFFSPRYKGGRASGGNLSYIMLSLDVNDAVV